MLNEFPPTTWWVWDEGSWPGLTMGSMRSMTSCEQPKRSMPWARAPGTNAAVAETDNFMVAVVIDGIDETKRG